MWTDECGLVGSIENLVLMLAHDDTICHMTLEGGTVSMVLEGDPWTGDLIQDSYGLHISWFDGDTWTLEAGAHDVELERRLLGETSTVTSYVGVEVTEFQLRFEPDVLV